MGDTFQIEEAGSTTAGSTPRNASLDDKAKHGPSYTVSEKALEVSSVRVLADLDKLERPTEEDKATLRRIADDLPVAAYLVMIVNFCERFALYGFSAVFQNYIQNPLPLGGNGAGSPASVDSTSPAGALHLGEKSANGLQYMFWFLSYVFPIPGAVIADILWGRYKTLTVSCFIDVIGLLIITVTSIPASLDRGGGLPGWVVGSILLAAGTGGNTVNASPFVADQFQNTEMYIRTLKSGERVIVDPNITITRIFNFFYWTGNVGTLSILATTQLERRVGFWAAFLLPTCLAVLACLLLIVGAKPYHKVSPRNSIILETWRVCKLVFENFFKHPRQFMKESKKSDIWIVARPSYIRRTSGGEATLAWLTWDENFVDEVKRTARACQIFLFYPLYWIAYNQFLTNLISQAATMSTHGVPNDLLQTFNPIALLIFIPIMDFVLYPVLRKIGKQPAPIFRIWLGYMVGAMAMVYSAVLQHFIYSTNPCGDMVTSCAIPSTINVWVQTPSYVLIAISESFTVITGFEYAYNKAPKRMKSVVTSAFLFMAAIGTALNIALSPVAQDPKLVGNYAGVAVATFVCGNIFYIYFWRRDSQEEAENAIGRVDEENGDPNESGKQHNLSTA